MSTKANCYLCNTTEGLTKDHIPPRNLFLEPLPNNLLTVACCRRCNEEYAKLDEQMRIFLSYSQKASSYGKQIWHTRVVASSFKRSPKLELTVKKHIITEKKELPDGVVEQDYMAIPSECVDKYLTRITKGLISAFYQKSDWGKTNFKITRIDGNEKVMSHLKGLNFHEKSGVFKCYYGITEDLLTGIWVFCFYDGEWFMITQSKNTLK